MTKRERRERLAMQAATAWNMAENNWALSAICSWMGLTPDRVWHLLEMHQKARARR